MANNVTFKENGIIPEVLADMVSAKLAAKIVATPYAKVDRTLEGNAGDTVKFPSWKYVGPAEDVAEGVTCDISQMAVDSKQETIKKAMKRIVVTDEAVNTTYGDIKSEIAKQLAMSLADKVDGDVIDELLTSTIIKTVGAKISYDGIVDAIDLFHEEMNSPKVMFVNPAQVTTLRKDDEFKDKDKYDGSDVKVSGEIGKIANTHIIPSNRVKYDAGTNTYSCPIIKLDVDGEVEDELAAITILMKQGVLLETKRNPENATTEYIASEHYGVGLTNEARVVIAKFDADTNSY